ncbi:MAG TPA: hypothetical protein VFL04_04795, partial [Rectinemataceae bacterium]|nr:hypothetical protein [Rectinemataceae bacterium]
MKSSQAAAIVLALLLCFAATAAATAQDSGSQGPAAPAAPAAPPAPSAPPAGGEAPPPAAPAAPSSGELGDNSPFLAGEQTIGLSAGAAIPVFMAPDSASSERKLLVGGVFSFQYQYFVQ